jgi:transposase
MTDYTLFVGVDIAATTATVAWGQQVQRLSSPFTLQQTPAAWQSLVDKLRVLSPDPSLCLIVMEATGTYWMQMALYLYKAGFVLSVINPIQSRYFARLQLQHTKTDEIDARLLAHLGMVMKPALWTPPPAIYDELQQRLAYRDDCVAMRVQERNRLHALLYHSTIVPTIQQRLELHIQYLTQQIKDLDREIDRLLNSPHAWAASALYLQSIPGIGANTAAWILTATLNFTSCDSPEEVTAFAGLAPHLRQSGSSLHSKRSIGHGGHQRLRQALYMAALPALRFNPIIRTFYHRLVTHGKPKQVALCAAARKLLHIAWAVVTKQSLFDPTHGPHRPLAHASP